MEYHQIKYFIKAAEHQNFSKAAEELFVSPQSVAKQISLLERELGIRLFERVGRRVILNLNGKYVFEKFQKVDQEMTAALEDIQNYIQNLNNRVRISFFSALPKKDLIAPLIEILLTRFSEYQFDLKMLSINETIGQLFSKNADIIITNIEENDEIEGIGRIVFHKHPAQIVVAPGHPWWKKDAVTVEEMEQMNMIKLQAVKRLDDNKTYLGLYDRVPCRKSIYVPNFETMYTLLEQGNVFAVLPRAFANYDNMDFRFLDLPIGNSNFDTAALFYKDSENIAVKRVLDFLKTEWKM